MAARGHQKQVISLRCAGDRSQATDRTAVLRRPIGRKLAVGGIPAQRAERPQCRECGAPLGRTVAFCPYCGITCTRAPNSGGQSNVVSFPRPAETAPPAIVAGAEMLSVTPPTAVRPASVEVPTIAAPQLSPPSEAKSAPTQMTDASELTPQPQRRKRSVAILVVTAVAGLALIWFVFGSNPSSSGNTVEFAVRDGVLVRSAPSSEGSSEIGRLTRGYRVVGTWGSGTRAGQWLKLAEGPLSGGFVSQTNLAASPPPALRETINGYMSISHSAQLLSQPDYQSQTLQQLTPGLSVFVVGITANDWLEIAPRRGGIGYLPRSAFQ